MDEHVHRALKDGALATRTKGRIETFKHHDYNDLERLVKEIRAQNPDDVIVVVTHDFYISDSSFSDLRRVQEICKASMAMNVIDVCDSLFFTGEDGLSRLKS